MCSANSGPTSVLVTPAKAGVQGSQRACGPWIPAFAGMTAAAATSINPNACSPTKAKRGAAGPLPSVFRRSGEGLLGGFGRSIVRRARLHRDEGAPADPLLELHRALFEREQRVILPHADPLAGMELGAALPHDDVAGDDDLAAEFLDPEPPPGAVATVARRAACFFMRHLEPPAPPRALAPLGCPALARRRATHPRRGSRRSATRSGTGGGRSSGGNCAAAFS